LWPNLLFLRDHKGVTPTEPQREQLYFGSLWAGLTLNLSGTGFPHPAGYPLSTNKGIPHGKASAVFLPDFIKHNAPAASSLTKLLLSVLGCDLETFCASIFALASLDKLRLTANEIEEYSASLEGRHNLENAVVPSTCEEIKTVYEKLFL
jgi:alcohol dehydrogenase class IV